MAKAPVTKETTVEPAPVLTTTDVIVEPAPVVTPVVTPAETPEVTESLPTVNLEGVKSGSEVTLANGTVITHY